MRSNEIELSMSQRSAISRIQLLIVLLIVALGIGLFLSFASKIRSSAEAMSCSNNLKQLGLAVHNYELTFDKLPPLADQGKGTLTNTGIPSVFALLTPYLEADPSYYSVGRTSAERYYAHSSVPFTYSNKDGTTGTEFGGIANQFYRKYFLDPADGTAHRMRDIAMTLPDGSTGYYATGSYAANGMAPWGISRFADSFPNGTADTILFGERPQVCQSPAGETTYNLWGVGFYSPHMPAFATLTPAESPEFWSTDQIAPALPLPDETAADRDARIRVRIGRRDAEPQPSDFPTPLQIIREGQPCDSWLPGTPHRSGMQVVMADGSVRVFTRDTNPWVFWAACTPSAR
jgi:competence protein ComGC